MIIKIIKKKKTETRNIYIYKQAKEYKMVSMVQYMHTSMASAQENPKWSIRAITRKLILIITYLRELPLKNILHGHIRSSLSWYLKNPDPSIPMNPTCF